MNIISKMFRYFLRLYRLIRCKVTVFFFKLAYPGLSFGKKVDIQTFVRVRVTDGGVMELADNVAIDRGVDLVAKYGALKIGCRTFIGQHSVLVARSNIHIGQDCLIGERVTIRDQDHAYTATGRTAENGFVTNEVLIGDNVWIGAGSTVLKGVSIGRNSVIAAGSVVTSDVPADCLFAGVPARQIKDLSLRLQRH